MRNDGIATAGIAAGLSFGLLCISILGLFARVDDRLVLTYAETFANLASIRDLFLARANYTALYNPPRVDHVLFPLAPDKLEDLEDLQRRGLFQTSVFMPNATSSVPAIQESFLHQLMQTAWCTYGVYRRDILPARRNPGCQCISDAYLSLMLETQGLNGSTILNLSLISNYTALVNGTNQTNNGTIKINQTVINTTYYSALAVINVSSDARQRAADKVYRCWDQRQVTRTRHCGKVCTTHVGSLALFANIILFLTCVSYLSYRTFNWNVYLVKAFIVFMGVLLSICYLVRDVEANSLTLGGLAVSLFYLTITLHTELSFTGEEDTRVGPHPLTTSLVVNLPLILSAHTIQIGVSGYGRDLWAFASFGVCGGLLGVVAQVPSLF